MGSTEKVSKYTNLFASFIVHFPHYLRTKRLVKAYEFATREEIRDFQYRRLKDLLIHAHQHVPYYQKLFDRIGFHPHDFQSIGDLSKLPLLTKQMVQQNPDEFKAVNISDKHFKVVQTGGTTGMPTEFFLDKRYSTLTEMVFLRHMWKQLGYRQRDRCVVLREDEVDQIEEGKKYWKRNWLTNWLTMSAFHLNADTFSLYYDKMQSFKPKFILAFPSNIYLLARFIEEHGLSPFPSVKGVICSSESLFDWQRDYISEVLNVRVFSFYGHSEKCVIAPQCSDLTGYEFYPQYGYAELVNEEGIPCSRENEKGEIVATGFHNYTAPLIRYKTGDVAVHAGEGGCDHPNWVKIKNLEGRIQDFLVDHDHVIKTYMHIDRPFWNLREKVNAYQYVQDEPGKVLLKIHPKQDLTATDLEEIKKIFHDTYLKFDLDIKLVEKISRTKGGKFRYLVQNIQMNDHQPSQRLKDDGSE